MLVGLLGNCCLSAEQIIIDVDPLSAMVAIWHDVIVSFNVLAQKEFIGTWISWVICIREKLTGVKSVFDGWM